MCVCVCVCVCMCMCVREGGRWGEGGRKESQSRCSPVCVSAAFLLAAADRVKLQ